MCRSAWIDGRATFTTVASRTTMNCARQTRTRTSQGRVVRCVMEGRCGRTASAQPIHRPRVSGPVRELADLAEGEAAGRLGRRPQRLEQPVRQLLAELSLEPVPRRGMQLLHAPE